MIPERAAPVAPRDRAASFAHHLIWVLVHAHVLPITFVVAVVGALLLNLNTPILRRVVASRVGAIIASSFRGKLVVDSVGRIGLNGIDEGNVRVLDPEGNVVAAAYGVHARISLPELLRSLFDKARPIDIHLTEVSIRAADFDLNVDPAGDLGIERAFASRDATPSTAPGRGARVLLDQVAVGHAWVHGAPVSGLPIDADADSVEGAVRVDAPRVAVDVRRVVVATRAMPYKADAHGTAEGHLVLPAPSGGAIGADLKWSGSVGGIAETVKGSIDGEGVDLTVDAPEVSPEALRALWPASPIDGAAAVHADVRGTLPRLDAHVHLTQGDATVDVAGPVVLGAGQKADLHLDARAVDLHALLSSAPASHLSATGDVTLTRSAAGAFGATGTVDFAGGHIAGAKVPSGKIRASFADDPKAGMRADANVTANEPGAPTVLALRLRPKGRSYELSFDGDTHVAALDAVPRIRAVARGQSDLKTNGVIDFGRREIDIKLGAEIRGLGHDVLSAEHASIDARVRGSLASPQVDLTVKGNVLDFGGYRFSQAVVDVHGPASAADVHLSLDADGDGTPDLGADGKLAIGPPTTIQDIHVHIARAREALAVKVGEVRIAHGELAIEPISVEGLGGPIRAAFHSTAREMRLQVQGEDIDLMRFERVSRIAEDIGGCIATVDVDVTMRGDGAEGHASAGLAKCTVAHMEGGAAALDLVFDKRKIGGRLHFEVADVGALELRSSAIEVGGAGPLPEAWKKAFGTVRFEAKVDTAKLAERLPPHYLPLDRMRGVVAVQGSVQRDSPTDDTPGVVLSLTTAGLALVGPSTRTVGADGKAVDSPPAWEVNGIDVGLDARADGDSGFAELSARLGDKKGELVAVDLKSGSVPYTSLFERPASALTLLETVEVNAHIVVPPRDLEALPPVLAVKGIQGVVDAVVTASGTLLEPVVDLTAHVAKARAEKGLAFPLQLGITAHYDGNRLTAAVTGAARKGQVMDAHLVADVSAIDLLDQDDSEWTASGGAHLDALPLESIAPLNDRQVSGTVSGDLKIDGLHDDGRATFNLDVAALKVGQVLYKTGALKATIGGKELAATVHFDQSDGSIDATANAGTKWGRALLPSLDSSRPPSAEVKAKRFRAALLLPFVDNSFTELDGRIDADLKAAFNPATGRPQLEGSAALTEGRFELASYGGEFHDVTAKLSVEPDGLVTLSDVKASAMSGVVEAAARARLNGLALEAADATIQIPASRPFLLTMEGVQIGTMNGELHVGVNETASTINVKVDIPTLHVELPLTSSRDVQVLGEMDGVRIGVVEKGAPELVPTRLDAPRETVTAPAGKTIVATVVLGSDVVVQKSNQLSVSLSGTPVFRIGSGLSASGQVRLLSGKIDVQGKSFDIDTGTVSFQGDPGDPQMVITASWTAADGTRVYADLRGTLKKPTVTLRSEPSYPRDQIVALLLYGAADATSPNAGAAEGVAGGAAAQPLNRALQNMGLGGVSARVDTSDVTPRADVEVQIARNLSLQVAEVVGVPPPGSNPDTTFFTVAWRFAKAWSAETTVGSLGTTILDLIWQHRY